MNSLNILSSRVIGSTPPPTSSQSRTHSYTDLAPVSSSSSSPSSLSTVKSSSKSSSQSRRTSRENALPDVEESISEKTQLLGADIAGEEEENCAEGSATKVYGSGEKIPLLDGQDDSGLGKAKLEGWRLITKRIASAFIASLRWLLSTLAAPGVYLVSCLYNDQGQFSPLWPIRRLSRVLPRRSARTSTAQSVGISGASAQDNAHANDRTSRFSFRKRLAPPFDRPGSSGSISSRTSDSELDETDSVRSMKMSTDSESHSRHTRSKSAASPSEEIAPARRSIRIKLYNEESLKQRKHQKSHSTASASGTSSSLSSSAQVPAISPATLKSPTSPASSLRRTKYPRTPTPPRPLIPPRRPSYAFIDPSISRAGQKTLILDLDETLIHSMAKGGRMGTGHMVEVKLNTPVGLGGGQVIGPQHPILYYVHKRPFCDNFLRKVCQWYNVVIFTASVQEYADPVIDWLEQDRKVFGGRYYRQHCTYRNGAYIKDISSIEPDLSKVMIVDNSPMSYIFHEDNAIPIEGWISDPTDNDLLHLIPLLEGLQYVNDVRALLALRMGESAT